MKKFLKMLWGALTERCYSFLHLALAITICMVFAFLMFCLGRWTPPEDMTGARFVEYNGRRYIEILCDDSLD